ncbi:hypothetical protein BG58_11035 [Caballeronia jiangsuensis]|nr:hypothetical protein BG58_11035 [Caballeronia jiangsuensis]
MSVLDYEVLRKLRYMGLYDKWSIADIDSYADTQIADYKALLEGLPKEVFLRVLFDIEDARQKALLHKYSWTVVPLT